MYPLKERPLTKLSQVCEEFFPSDMKYKNSCIFWHIWVWLRIHNGKSRQNHIYFYKIKPFHLYWWYRLWWLNSVCICFYAYVQTWIYIRIYLSVSPDIMDMAKCCFRSHLANSICHSRYYNLFGIGILNKKWYDNTLTTVQKYRG